MASSYVEICEWGMMDEVLRKAVASVLVHFVGRFDDGHDGGVKFSWCSHGYGQESGDNDLETWKWC